MHYAGENGVEAEEEERRGLVASHNQMRSLAGYNPYFLNRRLSLMAVYVCTRISHDCVRAGLRLSAAGERAALH
jgi:hypothetical protein